MKIFLRIKKSLMTWINKSSTIKPLLKDFNIDFNKEFN